MDFSRAGWAHRQIPKAAWVLIDGCWLLGSSVTDDGIPGACVLILYTQTLNLDFRSKNPRNEVFEKR